MWKYSQQVPHGHLYRRLRFRLLDCQWDEGVWNASLEKELQGGRAQLSGLLLLHQDKLALKVRQPGSIVPCYRNKKRKFNEQTESRQCELCGGSREPSKASVIMEIQLFSLSEQRSLGLQPS